MFVLLLSVAPSITVEKRKKRFNCRILEETATTTSKRKSRMRRSKLEPIRRRGSSVHDKSERNLQEQNLWVYRRWCFYRFRWTFPACLLTIHPENKKKGRNKWWFCHIIFGADLPNTKSQEWISLQTQGRPHQSVDVDIRLRASHRTSFSCGQSTREDEKREKIRRYLV